MINGINNSFDATLNGLTNIDMSDITCDTVTAHTGNFVDINVSGISTIGSVVIDYSAIDELFVNTKFTLEDGGIIILPLNSISDDYLSPNVALDYKLNVFTVLQTFNGGILVSGSVTLPNGSILDAYLSSNVPLKNTANTFTQLQTLNNGLTVTGTLTLPNGSIVDAYLTSNVPLKNAINTFTQTNTFPQINFTDVVGTKIQYYTGYTTEIQNNILRHNIPNGATHNFSINAVDMMTILANVINVNPTNTTTSRHLTFYTHPTNQPSRGACIGYNGGLIYRVGGAAGTDTHSFRTLTDTTIFTIASTGVTLNAGDFTMSTGVIQFPTAVGRKINYYTTAYYTEVQAGILRHVSATEHRLMCGTTDILTLTSTALTLSTGTDINQSGDGVILQTGTGTNTLKGIIINGNLTVSVGGSVNLPFNTILDDYLTPNVALLDNNQIFTGGNTFISPLILGTSTSAYGPRIYYYGGDGLFFTEIVSFTTGPAMRTVAQNKMFLNVEGSDVLSFDIFDTTLRTNSLKFVNGFGKEAAITIEDPGGADYLFLRNYEPSGWISFVCADSIDVGYNVIDLAYKELWLYGVTRICQDFLNWGLHTLFTQTNALFDIQNDVDSGSINFKVRSPPIPYYSTFLPGTISTPLQITTSNTTINNQAIFNNGISVTGSVTLPNNSISNNALSSDVVLLNATQTLTNKTLTDTNQIKFSNTSPDNRRQITLYENSQTNHAENYFIGISPYAIHYNIKNVTTPTISSHRFTIGSGTTYTDCLLINSSGLTLSTGILTLPNNSISNSSLSSDVVLKDASQTLTLKTLTSPTINTPTINTATLNNITTMNGNLNLPTTYVARTTGQLGWTPFSTDVAISGNLALALNTWYNLSYITLPVGVWIVHGQICYDCVTAGTIGYREITISTVSNASSDSTCVEIASNVAHFSGTNNRSICRISRHLVCGIERTIYLNFRFSQSLSGSYQINTSTQSGMNLSCVKIS